MHIIAYYAHILGIYLHKMVVGAPNIAYSCIMPWTETLQQLILSGEHRTQADLAAALAARGERVDQATVSRALRRLGARKVDGIYRLDQGVRAPIRRLSTTSGGCLVVLQTDAAFASVLAQRVDFAELPGVLGTIAGDDTVFVALAGPSVLGPLCEVLGVQPPGEST